ncbi:UGSC family (seleno)protein [Methanobacterium alcaliphilum]|uniref:UGSC family (seleno)protein n=1 Tax=Methanobacterium alcaliphilum TaxID=392018 RepID=UPI00200B2800|nr:UGSC family (seleno)protein [Methanobacterium alcaliphilum]MCK9151994.1 hypothetical protein [Methanobacterium alcaliphilum]
MKVNIVEREVMDPLAEPEGMKLILNNIPSQIRAISLFDNTKPGADVILETIASKLNNLKIINSEKPAGAPASKYQLKKATEGDVSILALGDCGSCTTWVILDAIRLEKKGIPTISICSDKFSSFARNLAQAHGAKDLRIIEISHPLSGKKAEEVEEKTFKIIPELKKILFNS